LGGWCRLWTLPLTGFGRQKKGRGDKMHWVRKARRSNPLCVAETFQPKKKKRFLDSKGEKERAGFL